MALVKSLRYGPAQCGSLQLCPKLGMKTCFPIYELIETPTLGLVIEAKSPLVVIQVTPPEAQGGGMEYQGWVTSPCEPGHMRSVMREIPESPGKAG